MGKKRKENQLLLHCSLPALMIYPGGKLCTSNNYLILCAVIISCASWHHLSNGCFIPPIWLMSHCAGSLLSLKVTNDNGKMFFSLQRFLLTESQDDLYSQDGITLAYPLRSPFPFPLGGTERGSRSTVHSGGHHWVVLKSYPPLCCRGPTGYHKLVWFCCCCRSFNGTTQDLHSQVWLCFEGKMQS